MTTHTIAMIGDMLAATAVDGDDAMMSERLADTLTQITEGDSTDVKYITGLTLYATVDDAEDDGAEVVYSGSDMGWLQDASGAMDYIAAGLKLVSRPFAGALVMDKQSPEARAARQEVQRLYRKIAYAARGMENRLHHAAHQELKLGRSYNYTDPYDRAVLDWRAASDEYHRATGQIT